MISNSGSKLPKLHQSLQINTQFNLILLGLPSEKTCPSNEKIFHCRMSSFWRSCADACGRLLVSYLSMTHCLCCWGLIKLICTSQPQHEVDTSGNWLKQWEEKYHWNTLAEKAVTLLLLPYMTLLHLHSKRSLKTTLHIVIHYIGCWVMAKVRTFSTTWF